MCIDLDRELKILWSIKVTVMMIIIGVLGKEPTSFVMGLKELEIGRRAKTIQTC